MEATRRSFNKDFLLALATDFKQHGASAIAKVRKQQPAAYMKICAFLVPREMKFEHSGGVKATSDEQLEAAIEAIQAMPAAKAGAPGDGAKVIEGVAAPALPASSPRTSSEESQTFTEITGVEPSTFGFAVAVHPRDPVAGAGAMPPIPANTRRSWSRSRPTSFWPMPPRPWGRCCR